MNKTLLFLGAAAILSLRAGFAAAVPVPESKGAMALELGPSYAPYDASAKRVPESTLIIRWRTGTLLGEPLVYADATLAVAPWQNFDYGDAASDLKDMISSLGQCPKAVLEKIGMPGTDVIARVKTSVALDRPVYFRFDLGAMGRSFAGSARDFDKLTAQEKKPYVSYNVTGSPEWSRFFCLTPLEDLRKGAAPQYLPADAAKKIMIAGFSLEKPGLVKPWFDLSPVYDWAAKGVSARLEQEKARIEPIRKQLDEQRKAYEKKKEEDFWNSPENPESLDSHVSRIMLEQSEREYRERSGKNAALLAQALALSQESADSGKRKNAALGESQAASFKRLRQALDDKIAARQRALCGDYPQIYRGITLTVKSDGPPPTEEQEKEWARQRAERDAQEQKDLEAKRAEWRTKMAEAEKDPEIVAARKQLAELENDYRSWAAQ